MVTRNCRVLDSPALNNMLSQILTRECSGEVSPFLPFRTRPSHPVRAASTHDSCSAHQACTPQWSRLSGTSELSNRIKLPELTSSPGLVSCLSFATVSQNAPACVGVAMGRICGGAGPVSGGNSGRILTGKCVIKAMGCYSLRCLIIITLGKRNTVCLTSR
jgi:hypothetical protein